MLIFHAHRINERTVSGISEDDPMQKAISISLKACYN